MYELPKFKTPKLKSFFKLSNTHKNNFRLAAITIFISVFFGFLAGAAAGGIFYFQIKDYLKKSNISSPIIGENAISGYIPQTLQEQAVINAVKKVSPAVVSIIISKDMPVYEEYYENPLKEYEEFFGPMPEFRIPKYRQKGSQKKEIGGGTGFIVSQDGLVLTNKHVILDEDADYTVLTNDGRKFSAKVLAKDPVQDLAIIKIEQEKTTDGQGGIVLKPFSTVTLGDSDKLQIGQTVIAIGNALGEFRNTVSAGVISGLGRKITASGGDFVESLEDVIQTDAAINKGNSGGPLLNLKGEVIGVNTAMVLEAQSIGFTIPINKAKKDIEQVRALGKIVYPFLGVRYVLVDEEIKENNNLSVDYGALVVKGDKEESAITPGSAAEKAGLKEGDIILELNSEKITVENSLSKVIAKYNPGDKITLKILRPARQPDGSYGGGEEKEKTIEVVLGERSE